MSNAHTITISLDEALSFVDTSMGSPGFRSPEQQGRFEVMGSDESAEDLIADSTFDNGTFHWVEGHMEALVLTKVLRAEGFTSHLLWDMAPSGADSDRPSGYVVLTSREPGF